MIILDERNFLRQEFEDKGFGVFDFFEEPQVLAAGGFTALPLTRRAEVLLVDTQTLLDHPEIHQAFGATINTFIGVIFFHEQKNLKAQEWVRDQAAFMTKIVGEYALPMPQLNWTMLANQLQFFSSIILEQKSLQKQMTEFSLELDQVLQNAQLEMSRAKNIHETLIPRRNEEIKGINFLNKYATGDGGGAEFYDLLQAPNKVFQVLVTSQSYLITSSLMGILNLYKKKGFDPASFLADAKSEISTINQAKKKKAHVDLLVLELDLTTLNLRTFGESKAEFYNQKGRIDLSSGVHQLGKGEKFIVFSSGFLFNWKEEKPSPDLYSFISAHSKLASVELMTELFFQIKKDKEEEFLKKDATVAIMEVGRNGIQKV
ncbi:MAG TPA: hypothetical protein VNJ01_02960 [Bacteriovoracaceae bacterium]|nr:hypothetical protein [Bacteriovoracaceae bacterium]